MNPAQQIHADRLTSERELHLMRLAWLMSPLPLWSCGCPLPRGDRNTLIELSRQWLANNPERS